LLYPPYIDSLKIIVGNEKHHCNSKVFIFYVAFLFKKIEDAIKQIQTKKILK